MRRIVKVSLVFSVISRPRSWRRFRNTRSVIDNPSPLLSKPIVSVSEMAQILQISRARFYQLLEMGFFPPPLKDERSGRPYYDIELQQKCLECRQSSIGVNGSILLFYSPRKKSTQSPKLNQNTVDPQIEELTETLENMGLKVSRKEVEQSLVQLYPDGAEKPELGIMIRQLFLHLKQ